MSEIFNEQLVKREPQSMDVIKKVIFVVVAIIVVFAVLLTQLFFFVALVVIVEGFILRFLFQGMNLEFEYIMTNHELDIDKIISKSKRKHMHTLNVKSIIAMAKYQEMDKSTEFKSFDKKVNVSSGVLKDNTYAFIINEDRKRVLVIFEPNEKILKSMKIYMTTRVL